MAEALRVAAPAKLNLYLHVTGKRADGYHLLDGLVAFADIHDTLALASASSLAFTAEGPFASALGDGESNLVVRAARELGAKAGFEPNVRLVLTKMLPVASGIGGGSADAAACLRGLASLQDLDPNSPILREVAARLGSDIPVCVAGQAAFIGGVGADIEPAPRLPPVWVVLVNPGIGLPTPDVYRARQGAFTPPMRFSESPRTAAELAEWLMARSNDLTEPAIGIVPEIGSVLAVVGESRGCLLARMSGSGATCFGLYDDANTAHAAADAIRTRQRNWWVAAGQLLDDTSKLVAD